MKPLVCIFAHPDDEAFGPGGTIALEAKRRQVYIICSTKGEAGKHKGKKTKIDLSKIRDKELLKSAKVLGVKQVFFLGFQDGSLSNSLYHDIAGKIEKILKKIRPDTILTFEPRGISGHIDHITMSLVSSYVFRRLKFIKTLMQYCLLDSKERRKRTKNYFIYVPNSYKKSEIDLIVDTSSVWSTKVEAMYQHQSQIHDIKRILKSVTKQSKKEYFLITKRGN